MLGRVLHAFLGIPCGSSTKNKIKKLTDYLGLTLVKDVAESDKMEGLKRELAWGPSRPNPMYPIVSNRPDAEP